VKELSNARSDVSLLSDQIISAFLRSFEDTHAPPTHDDITLHLDKLMERVKVLEREGIAMKNSVTRGIVLRISGLNENASSSHLTLKTLLFSGDLTSGHKHLGFKSNLSNFKQQLVRPTEMSLRDFYESDSKLWLRTTVSILKAYGVGLIIAKGIVDAILKTNLEELGIGVAENIDFEDFRMLTRYCRLKPIAYPTEEQIRSAGEGNVVMEMVQCQSGTDSFFAVCPSKPSLLPHYTAILHAPNSSWSDLKRDKLRHLLRRWHFFAAEGYLVDLEALVKYWMDQRLKSDVNEDEMSNINPSYFSDLSGIAQSAIKHLLHDGRIKSIFVNLSVLEKFVSMAQSVVDALLSGSPLYVDGEF